ncbi:retrovirus-related pol polyprotein from transposon TNT 1-94 [Tanacetum coccineum]
MTSPNKPTSKPSRVAKMSVKPISKKKPNLCNTSNVFNTTSPIPKPLTPHHKPSQENNHPNQALQNPYIKDTPTSPQVISHPPLPISPINSHTAHTQAPPQIEESLNVTFDETPPPSKTSPLVDDDLDEEEAIKVTEKKNLENDIVDETLEIDEIVNIKESRNHPLENVIGNLNQRTLRSQAQNQSNFFCFISTIEPKNVNEALGDERTKWVFRNKLDENGVVSQNKARLVAQGYNQQEGIDYDETYAPVARLKSIRILLAYAYALDFKLFQMDVKSAFLNGFINEEYIKEMLKKFSLEDSKPMKTPMSLNTKLTKDEECNSVYSTKYRGMIGSLLYLTASRLNIMFSVCLCARFQEDPKTSHLEAVKRIFQYIKGTMHLGLWYHKGTSIETVAYADSDQARDYVDQKNTSGICTFVGCCLTSWFSKKQTNLAISTTESEYVSAGRHVNKYYG